MSKWSIKNKSLNLGKISAYKIYQDNKILSFGDFLKLLIENEDFRIYFNNLLASSAYSAFRWETPGVTQNKLDMNFSFVLVNSPGLIRRIDRNSFKEHFKEYDSIAVAPNLSGDAIMIIPSPGQNGNDYGHLAEFVRKAPLEVIHKFWIIAGEEMLSILEKRKCWLSTAGAGVSWLHLRLDSKPKYYTYSTYRNS